MERESFEDQEVAELLNDYFIPIKVDREERPDIDHIYMEFCQALTSSGGWPLTIFMTPDDQKPFYAGTYFPKERRYGRAGLMDILKSLGELWKDDEPKVRQSANEIFQAVTSGNITSDQPMVFKDKNDFKLWAEETIDAAYASFEKRFDNRFGGFGRAPKFPSPHNLSFLLRYAYDHPESQALRMVHITLDKMGKGGIYDHIGYGFARYSTDNEWLVPHFEKMLYDNALLAIAYLEAYQFEQVPVYEEKAREIFRYVLRDMTSPKGGFYSAEDADSEGEEGKYYVWTPAEIHKILGDQRAQIYCKAYDITEDGNFEGKNIPNLLQTDLEKTASEFQSPITTFLEELEKCREELFQAREKRIHPHKDDKILTSWNGLMIVAFAKGAQIFRDTNYFQAAEKAAQFLLTKLYRDHRLLARFREGEAAYPAYLDDYAFLIWGLLELYEASGNVNYLKNALTLQEEQDRLFLDEKGTGYYLTGSDAEELLIRPKEVYDGAMPSGNSVSALNLIRLARMTGDEKWERRAEKQIYSFESELAQFPAGYTAFLQAMQFTLNPSKEIILAGDPKNQEYTKMKTLCLTSFAPYKTMLYQNNEISQIIPWLEGYPRNPDQATAYVCENYACHQPVHTAKELESLL